MIFKQETIKSWFTGINSSINSEAIKPFQNAEQVIWKYNQAIEHNSLTQNGWNRILAQSDDSLKMYLTSIKGTTASMTGYTTSLQGNIVGFRKVSSAITQYNSIASTGTANQTTFANAVSATNAKLGTYLVGLNGAKASIGGYALSLVGATVKTIALQFATIALNSAITMGASLIISGIVSAISEWIHKTENMISASEDAIEKIKSINDELKNNQKTISETAKRYAELAQGVNQLTGENNSLSNEDYEEFLSLSNQLAEMFPTLTRNYNDNGDAIVQLSGDVDTIVGSLQNLIETQRDLANRQIVDELPTVFDGVATKSDKYEQQLADLESRRDTLIKSLGDVQSEEFSSNFMDSFSNKWIEISGDNLEVISQMRDDYMKILKETNIDFEELTPTYEIKDGIEAPVRFTIKINSSDEDIEKAENTIDGKIQELASQYETDINKLNEEINTTNEKNKANWTSLSSSIFAWLSTDDSFKVMDDTMQATVQNIVNSLDWGSLDFSSWEDAKQYIQENILSLFNTPEGKGTLEDIEVMFGIQTQFNNGDISVNDYQDKIQELLANIERLPDETKKSIMWLFGINFEEDGTTSSDTDTLINNVKEKLQDDFDDKVGELTLEELHIVAEQVEVPEGTLLSWDELIAKIKEVQDSTSNNPISFTDIFSTKNADDTLTTLGKLSESIDNIQNAYKTLSSAIDEYNDNGVISIDNLQSVIALGDDWLDYLVDEDGALKLDKESLEELTRSRLENMRTQALNNVIDNVSKINNDADANLYLASTNYAAAETFNELAKQSAYAAENLLLAKVAAGDLSQSSYDAVINKMYADIDKINALFDNTTFDLSFDTSKASKSAKETARSFTDLLNKELSVLDKKMEAGYIDFNDYIKARLALIQDYYDKGKIAADEYYSYLEKHYKQELSYRDKVIKAVDRRIDKEIKSLQKQKDKVKETYQTQIDALEKQKTLLEDANRERQREIDLQKALYELERARNQRTKLVYSEDKGMHYVSDPQAIRDAEQEAENQKFQVQIADIEKSITKLEQARDAETDAIDAMIDKLEEYREQWNDITSAYEESQEDLIAAQILGQEWENDILAMRLDTLNKFKDDYIAIQQAMVDAAYEAAQAMANAENVKIGDSSKGKLSDKNNGTHGWEVIDEATATTVRKDFNSEKEAKNYADKMNYNKASANNMSLSEFYNSNIPGYYVKKYHTGLKQGLVDKHSFDEDFKLVQKVGLGDKEVPAILQEGETVATPEQISNIADGLRKTAVTDDSIWTTLADGTKVRPLQPGDKMYDMVQKFDAYFQKMNGNLDMLVPNSLYEHNRQMNEMANQISYVSNVMNNNQNVQQPIVNHINVTLPNVTNSTSAETLMRDLQSLNTKKFQVDWK